MAGALRPVVALMVLASVLLVADGLLDGVWPGGDAWRSDAYHGLGWSPYAFALLNLVAAVFVARGSERGLVGRIGLSGFLLVERPLSAFLLGPKPPEAVAVHAATALVELVILLSGLRVWRLGRSLGDADLVAILGGGAGKPPPPGAPVLRVEWRVAARASWAVGLLAFLLAAVLVADGALAGYVPGGKSWGTTVDSAGWVEYLYAVGVLSVASRAVRGGVPTLRLLFALALALFLERAFSPFLLPIPSASALALHALAAFTALALALAAVGALRGGEPSGARSSEPA